MSAVVKYLDKLNDICVSKAVPYRRGRRGVRLRLHRFNEALSILFESPLLQQPRRKI